MNPEQDEQSGLSAVFGEEPAPVAASEPEEVEPPEEVVEESQPEPEPQESVAEEVTEPEPKPSIEDELRQLREKVSHLEAVPDHIRRLDGRYGELHRAQQQMQQTKVQLSPDKFKKLSESFPELADALASDLSEAFAPPAAPVPQFDPAQFEDTVNSRVADALHRQEQKFNLTMRHPDWKETTSGDGFRQWASTQPAEIQHALANSWDADFISQQISAFKQTIKPVESPKVSAKSKVIQAAVTPAGSRTAMPATDSEADAFLRAARGG